MTSKCAGPRPVVGRLADLSGIPLATVLRRCACRTLDCGEELALQPERFAMWASCRDMPEAVAEMDVCPPS